jgi:hypothetical protein
MSRLTTTWYRAATVVVPAAVAMMCALAAVIGEWRWGDAAWAFRFIRGASHPGLMTIVTAMAWMTAAAVLCLTAALTERRRVHWLIASLWALFLVGVELVRAHRVVPGGDILVRLLLIAGAVVGVRVLRPALVSTQGLRPAVAGAGFLLLSEVVGAAGGAGSSRFVVVEESCAAVGAWLLAVAVFGAVLALLSAQPAPTPSTSQSSSPSPLPPDSGIAAVTLGSAAGGRLRHGTEERTSVT